jgi:hypothetical protein
MISHVTDKKTTLFLIKGVFNMSHFVNTPKLKSVNGKYGLK